MNILGVKWYHSLVREGGLLEKEKSGLFICFTPSISFYSNFRHVKDDIEKIRLFARFSDYIDFYDYYCKVPPEERSFYEIIPGDCCQKPHFDIDLEDPSIDWKILISDLICSSEEVLSEVGIKLNVSKDVLLYSSCGKSGDKYKYSFHVVYDNMFSINSSQCGNFYRKIMEKIPQYSNIIDHAVYSSMQQFRIFGCKKIGTDRTKIFVRDIPYKGCLVSHEDSGEEDIFFPLGDEVRSDNVQEQRYKDLSMLSKSLVSFTETCSNIIPSFCSESYSDYDDDELDFDPQDILDLFSEEFDMVFVIKSVKGNVIVLQRLVPSYCPTCEKVHDGENPYIRVTKSRALFNCRRDAEYRYLSVDLQNKGNFYKETRVTSTVPSTPCKKSSSIDSRKYVPKKRKTLEEIYSKACNDKKEVPISHEDIDNQGAVPMSFESSPERHYKMSIDIHLAKKPNLRAMRNERLSLNRQMKGKKNEQRRDNGGIHKS